MVTIHEVRESMVRHWPSGMPSWDDPHAGGAAPVEDEYSRVTDGQRYRVVVERARAWTTACAETLGARITPLAPTDPDRQGWVLTSPRPSTAPLRVEVMDVGFPLVVVGCGAAQVIERFPDCGCDACDEGSESLLDGMDDWFVNALNGGLAHIWGEEWSATRHSVGARAGGSTDAPARLDYEDARRQLAVIAGGGTPDLPAGLCWTWSGHWTD